MILRKTLSSVSINRLAVAALALCGGGCAARHQAAAPHTVYGYVDLTALVRQQPGWAGLGQYDAALARLSAAANLPPAGQADPKMATLPALPPHAAENDAPQAKDASAKDVSEIARHLSLVQSALLGGLSDRRKTARDDQINRQQDLWKRDARNLFPIPTRTAEISSDLTLQLLETNVAALTQTLDHWDNSTPPAPRLARLKLKVEADRNRLTTLIAARIQARETARAARLAAIQRQRAARLDYVRAQGDTLAAHLEAEDTRVLEGQQRRLSAQRLALLGALARPEPVSVPAAGDAGALVLPSGPGAARASLSAASLKAARARLLAQRGRWAQYLYDDTRASALDAAARLHWNITFGPPRRGDRNLTADLERVLAKTGTG